MPDERLTHEAVAMAFEDSAAEIVSALIAGANPGYDILALAQVQATLALGQRVADLTDQLGEYLGDDSHLDGLKVTLRDLGQR